MRDLVERLLALHRAGSLHIMDNGNVCVGCGGQWPCGTKRIIDDWAMSAALRSEDEQA